MSGKNKIKMAGAKSAFQMFRRHKAKHIACDTRRDKVCCVCMCCENMSECLEILRHCWWLFLPSPSDHNTCLRLVRVAASSPAVTTAVWSRRSDERE